MHAQVILQLLETHLIASRSTIDHVEGDLGRSGLQLLLLLLLLLLMLLLLMLLLLMLLLFLFPK